MQLRPYINSARVILPQKDGILTLVKKNVGKKTVFVTLVKKIKKKHVWA